MNQGDPFPVVTVDFNDRPIYGEASYNVKPGRRVLFRDFDGSVECEAIVTHADWGTGDPAVWFVEGEPDWRTVRRYPELT